MGFVCLVGWLVGFLTTSSTTRLYRGRVPRLTSDNCTSCHIETEWGDHDYCLSRSHYNDTDLTSREWAATAGIEPKTSSPRVQRSTIELSSPPQCIGYINPNFLKNQKLIRIVLTSYLQKRFPLFSHD